MATQKISYTYDSRGNRTSMTVKRPGQADVVTTYTYNAGNQLVSEDTGGAVTTYEYDACGNRTKKDAPSEITFYEWNSKNQMTKASPPSGDIEFLYDPNGQRVEKKTPTETIRYLYDHNRLLMEYDDSGDAQTTFTATLDEYGDLVSEYNEFSDATSYHQYDALGSTDALLDDNETETDRYKYTAFGLQQTHAGSSDSPFTFVGKQGYYNDPEIDLYYLGIGNNEGGGRNYDPATGQFLSDDREGFAAGDTNLRRYVGNNVPNMRDPSGLEDEAEKYSVEISTGKVSTSVHNMPVYVDKALDKWSDIAAMNSVVMRINAKCVGNKIVVSGVEFRLFIAVGSKNQKAKIGRDLTLRGVYGHEQLHLRQLIRSIREEKKTVISSLLDDLAGEAPCECEKQLEKLKNEYHEKLWDLLGPAFAHQWPGQTETGNPDGPAWGTPSNAIGAPPQSARGFRERGEARVPMHGKDGWFSPTDQILNVERAFPDWEFAGGMRPPFISNYQGEPMDPGDPPVNDDGMYFDTKEQKSKSYSKPE